MKILSPYRFLGPTINIGNSEILFLDLDGVLWPDEESSKITKIRIDKEIKSGLKKIAGEVGPIIVITNQTLGARKFRNLKFYKLMLWVKFTLLLILNPTIQGVFLCFHHPHSRFEAYRQFCECRKPGSFLFTEALSFFESEANSAICIGDRITDMYAASGAGVQTNHLLAGDRMFEIAQNPHFDFLKTSPVFKISSHFSELLLGRFKENQLQNDLLILYLCAGYGTRLAPFTNELPKPLLDVNGNFLVERLAMEINEYFPESSHLINISFLAEKFSLLAQRLNSKLDLLFAYEIEPLGSSETLMRVTQVFDSAPDILVLHGDLFLSRAYVKELSSLVRSAERSTIFGHYRESEFARSSIVTDEDGLVVSFINGKPKESGLHIVNSGIYLFKGSDLKSLNVLPDGGEIACSVVPELVEKRRLGCKVIDENRISVDSISALEAALSMAKNGDG
jgi:D-glycero-D-manno-heptose 1,7-bisphosphate phosphatase